MERLLHYSAEPLKSVSSCEQSQDKQYKIFKPRGLWVSAEGEDDWKSWCEAEGFCLDRLNHVTEILLAPQANILRLTNAHEVREFSAQYAYDSFADLKLPPHYKMGVHWDQVAALYQGIIIAPHCYSVRHDADCFWYYTWDCASGCIWDAAAIAALAPVQGALLPPLGA